ncbi:MULTISPECIES: glycerate kinase [Nocardiopsis]|uniref:Glycerate kinase n=1 Tax=Nocardiopsis alba TaxID=53437 RepID=A0A7K2ITB5_9ACTN|nr:MULTISPECIES: glycerate kinase [Nocardiopsis]MEC3893633.1 glycerate kinase [Nocardiopsis sp. LDBS1602]MYR33220.1 glycerate kinase [Nocardiopsis alba]
MLCVMSKEMREQDETTDAVRVVAIPDSFKGSASAIEVAEAMADGAREAYADRGVAVSVHTLPFADGGEGTLDALLGAWGTKALTVDTTDALGRPTRARYGVSADGRTGVVEAAEANGLPGVADVPLQARTASSRGVGPLVSALLDQGVEEILLCIGGSASTDGGTGMLSALGVRFLDSEGSELPDGGGELTNLASLDLSGLDQRARSVRWRIACDVTNPLVGERGAAAVFGPQKGASPEDVRVLDAGLARLADVLAEATGQDLREVEGMGAAGGIPVTMSALLGAELVPGSRMVAEVLDADRLLGEADLVLTGEGRFDSQSLGGKVVDAVRRLTPEHVPVVVIAGSVSVTAEELRRSGVTAAFSIARGPRTLEEMREETLPEITSTAYQCCRLLTHPALPSTVQPVPGTH